ncbi:uncharacterized protein L201_006416 [Kwoniella dendrophila CBS 6074]|uniref:Nudix hydrolase domain-containing protein n=1 Tax=Kwoniella dendrophila CBS 6074 TaxID=1295534 RepID=A0AAX4K3T8_9TREE
MKLWEYLKTLRAARAHVNAGTDHRSKPIPDHSIPLNPDDWLIDLEPGTNYDDKPDVKMYLRLIGKASTPQLRNEQDQIEAGRSYLAEEMREERGVFVLPSDLSSTPHNALQNPYYLSTLSDKPLEWTKLDSRGWWYFTSLTPVMMRARCFMDKQGGRPGEKFVMTRNSNVTDFKERNPGLKFEYVKTNIRAPLLAGVTPPEYNTDRFALLTSQLYKTNIHPALRYHFLCLADIEEIEEHIDSMLDLYNFYDTPSIWNTVNGLRPGSYSILRWLVRRKRKKRAEDIEKLRKYDFED